MLGIVIYSIVEQGELGFGVDLCAKLLSEWMK